MREHVERQRAGERLKEALQSLYPRSRGGLRQLAEDARIGPETLYRWFRGDSEPDLGTLRRLATACGVSRSQLVAAMDDEVPAPPAWATIEGRMAKLEALSLAIAAATPGVDLSEVEELDRRVLELEQARQQHDAQRRTEGAHARDE